MSKYKVEITRHNDFFSRYLITLYKTAGVYDETWYPTYKILFAVSLKRARKKAKFLLDTVEPIEVLTPEDINARSEADTSGSITTLGDTT